MRYLTGILFSRLFSLQRSFEKSEKLGKFSDFCTPPRHPLLSPFLPPNSPRPNTVVTCKQQRQRTDRAIIETIAGGTLQDGTMGAASGLDW